MQICIYREWTSNRNETEKKLVYDLKGSDHLNKFIKRKIEKIIE